MVHISYVCMFTVLVGTKYGTEIQGYNIITLGGQSLITLCTGTGWNWEEYKGFPKGNCGFDTLWRISERYEIL